MKRIQSKHENKISNTTESATVKENEDCRSVWYILGVTLAPLYYLLIIGAIVVALIMLDRHFIQVTHFIFQQNIFIAILIIGMIVAIIVYARSIIHALRKIGMWRRNGYTMQANMGLLVLTLVASFMLLPVILALFFH